MGPLTSTMTPTHFSATIRPCEKSRWTQSKQLFPLKVVGYHVISLMAEIVRVAPCSA